MRWIFIAFGAVMGFVYEFGMTWYVTWSPQARARTRGEPMLGPDSVIMSGLVGLFWGVLLTALIAQWYLTLRHRHAINTTALRRQLETEEIEGGVWPPPPIDQTDQTGDR